MRSVEQLIGDLLLRHNCVIVPSFGGFVAKPISASIDFKKGTMTPPSKSLLFNKQLINNDGLLVSEFAASNDLSFDEATIEIENKVLGWNEQLKTGARIELEKVGHLFFDAERNICFEQDRFFNLLLESFGLSSVHFLSEEDVKVVERKIEVQEAQTPVLEEKVPTTPIIPLVKTEEIVSEEKVTVVEHPEIKKRRKPVWRYVAAACLLPIAFYSFWIPMRTDVLESGVLSINDFNPFYSSTEGIYTHSELKGELDQKTDSKSLEEQIDQIETNVDVYSFEVDKGEVVLVALENEKGEDNSALPVDTPQNDIEANSMNYIVGCFGEKSNAVNLVAKLKAEGMNAYVVDVHNGLHRVSAGSAISLESFAQIKVQAENLGYAGWTLK